MESIVEASTLGLGPGEWPDKIWYNGVVYLRSLTEIVEGEIVSVIYTRPGSRLVVLND